MAHGYLGDGYGTHGEIDPDRGDERNRNREDHRNRDWRERGWRGSDDWSGTRDEDRGSIFGRDQRGWREGEQDWSSKHGWSGPSGEHSRFGSQNDYRDQDERGGYGGFRDSSGGARGYSANPDDHYRSWRDRHMSELDRDYADYCREREQQFHQEFNQWRSNRQQPGDARRDEIAVASENERSHRRAMNEEGTTPTPVGEATLGSNNSENTTTGRARGRS